MRQPDAKTVSPLPGEVVEQLIARWNGKEGTASCINVGTNVVFRFRTSAGDLVLRVHHTGDRRPEEVEAELEWVDFLHSHGCPVAPPVASASGKWLETLKWEMRLLLAAAFRKAPGHHPQLHTGTKWKRRLVRRVGGVLGRMHALSRVYDAPSAANRFDWSAIDLPGFAKTITAQGDEAYLENLNAHWQWIQSLPKDDSEAFGLVHGDFHSANLLIKRSHISVIDFDGACYNWFLFDIAHFFGNTLLSLPTKDPEVRRESARRLFVEFMHGYIRENRIKSDWFQFFPFFLRGFVLLYYFGLLANFQGENKGQLNKAPYYEPIRNMALSGEPLVELDFRQLYKEVETPRLVRWFITHIMKPTGPPS